MDGRVPGADPGEAPPYGKVTISPSSGIAAR